MRRVIWVRAATVDEHRRHSGFWLGAETIGEAIDPFPPMQTGTDPGGEAAKRILSLQLNEVTYASV
jgi:hypothetical protein